MSNGTGLPNLVPLTSEKAREVGRRGGIASGKAKRAERDFAEALKGTAQETAEEDHLDDVPA